MLTTQDNISMQMTLVSTIALKDNKQMIVRHLQGHYDGGQKECM